MSISAEVADDLGPLPGLGGTTMQVLVDGARTDGKLAISRLRMPAGATVPLHAHAGQDIILLLLRGSMAVQLMGQGYELDEGSVAVLPRGLAHAYHVTVETDLLLLSTPSGPEDSACDAAVRVAPQPERRPVATALPGLAPYIARADEHEVLEWLDGGLVRILLDAGRTGGRLSLGRSTFRAGSTSPIYVHGKEDEVVVMMRGSAIYWVGERRYDVSAGDVVVIPRGVSTAHRMTTDAEILVATSPGGLEELFRAACRDARLPRPENWQVSFDALRRAAEAAGQTLIAAPA
ncbi:cupin domain-containing protein [Promicromonospora sp. NPDC050880]|uniref:cupin domain-containing protein n=1 Tax=Promicromonospora sp. NPDC050880 TaxID=3364406 RepID=UPI0037B74337